MHVGGAPETERFSRQKFCVNQAESAITSKPPKRVRSLRTCDQLMSVAGVAIVLASLILDVDFATAGCGPFGN